MQLEKSKTVEFGSGKVAIALIARDGTMNSIAFVERETEHAIASDADDDMSEEEFKGGLRAVFTFHKAESIDAVINQLNKLKEEMVLIN